MDKSLEPQRHYHRSLPRAWITLPAAVARRALEDPLLRDLFPSHVGYFPKAREHRVERERPLQSSVFNYCVAGSGWCTFGTARHRVGPGELMVVPAGHAHAYGADPSDPWTLHWFHAMGRNVRLLIERLGITAESPVVHIGRSPKLEALFTEMREALENDYSEHQLVYSAQTLAHLMAVMTRLRREHPHAEPSAEQRVLATLEHVKTHLGAPHDVARLATLAKLSASHFSALVHACTGYPPKEYVTRLRMHRATQLLDTTTLSIKTIAREVGFLDALHFSRVFRRINEHSPREYRERARVRAPSSRRARLERKRPPA